MLCPPSGRSFSLSMGSRAFTPLENSRAVAAMTKTARTQRPVIFQPRWRLRGGTGCAQAGGSASRRAKGPVPYHSASFFSLSSFI